MLTMYDFVSPNFCAIVSGLKCWALRRLTSRMRSVVDGGRLARFSTRLIRKRSSSGASLMIAGIIVSPSP